MHSENHGAAASRRQRTRVVICLAGLAAGVALVIGALSAGASGTTAVSITSGTTTVGGTTTLTASINLDAADAAFNGFDITVTWDSDIATATNPGDVTVSPSFGFAVETTDNGPGVVHIIRAHQGQDHPCALGTQCTLFSITFHGNTDGNTDVNMTGALSAAGSTVTASFGSGTITVGSGTTVTNTPITNTPVTNTTTPGTTTNTPVTNTPVTDTPVTNTPVTQTNTPGTNTPSPTGTHTPSSTPTKTNTATPTPTGTPHPSGHRAVIPEVARDGTS